MDNYTGKRIDGRYEIQEVIGVGGMAVVYKAYDNIDDRIVAVKILKDEYLANEDFRRRFKNESKAISLLSHPNIVKVYNVNYGDKLQYIVMEYVEGITLKEYIEQQGRLGIKETVYFTMQILRALQHAHDKGIIHRDIKPQNIMLLSNGNIKVTDFGIARFSYSDTKTMTDSAIGSVHYISPEQARGNSIDERTDIYSVGVVMYEMLTGTLPFVSDNSVSVALMQLQNDPKSVREINPNIPVGLEQIVNRAMQKNTKSRYQTASEMLMDIEEFKRNPNIRFQQNYFVDSDPTKYVNRPSDVVTPAPKKPVSDAVQINEPEYEEEPASKSKLGIIISGVLIGLVAVALVVFGVLFFFTDTFSKSEDVVPDFTGMNYESQIQDNNMFKKYNIVVEDISRNGIDDGTVIDQKPSPNTKLKTLDTQITLYVVDNEKKVQVPDVSGYFLEQAQKLLKNQGFVVTPVESLSVVEEYGKVIKTDPAKLTEVPYGSNVTVYYASDTGFVDVPNVVGMNKEMAKSILESVNLKMDDTVAEEESDRPEGEVVAQSPEYQEKVLPGSKVKITVSTGVPKSRECNITITLPSTGSRGNFEVYVNNENKITRSLLMDGSSYSFAVEGGEKNASVKVYIDNKQYYTCNVDFTQSNPSAQNGSYTSAGVIISYKTLPNVTGNLMQAATATLNEAGFYNIKYKTQTVTSPADDGKVLSMEPVPGNTVLTNRFETNTEITLTVGQKEGV